MPKVHQWLVVRGRVTIRGEDSRVVVELDPEGSAYCVLSTQDAHEISGIISDLARAIWQRHGESPEPPATVDGDVYKACRLMTETGVLQVIAHDSMPLMAISFNGSSSCDMNVTQAVALVQILGYMGETLLERADAGAA
jgi:hypothetical protein